MAVRKPEDLVAFAPQALGFLPERSVVMLTFKDARTMFHARCDLPDSVQGIDAVTQVLLRAARKHRVDSVAFLVYDDDTTMSDELVWMLRDTFVDDDFCVLEILRIHRDHWFAVLPGHPPECYRGVPYDLTTHPITAMGVFQGRETLVSREALRATLDPDVEATRATEAALAHAEPLTAQEFQLLVSEHLASETAFGVDDLAAVVQTVQTGAGRDGMWEIITREHAMTAVVLWSDAVRRTPASHVAAVAAVLGFTAWLAGDGALAWCAVDRSRAVEPDHFLAALVAALLESATAPDQWALIREELFEAHGPAA